MCSVIVFLLVFLLLVFLSNFTFFLLDVFDLTIEASFLYQSQNLIELGKNLGFSKFKCFYSIILPAARPAIVAKVSKLKGLNINVIGNSLTISNEINIITNNKEFLK